MKTKILIITIGLLFAFTTNAQRKLSVDKVQIRKTKNAKIVGTDARGNAFDNSGILDTLASKNDLQNIDLSTKLEVGTYTGTASDLKSDIDNINIPSYKAGTNIVIENDTIKGKTSKELCQSEESVLLETVNPEFGGEFSIGYHSVFMFSKLYDLDELTFKVTFSTDVVLYEYNSSSDSFVNPVSYTSGTHDLSSYIRNTLISLGEDSHQSQAVYILHNKNTEPVSKFEVFNTFSICRKIKANNTFISSLKTDLENYKYNDLKIINTREIVGKSVTVPTIFGTTGNNFMSKGSKFRAYLDDAKTKIVNIGQEFSSSGAWGFWTSNSFMKIAPYYSSTSINAIELSSSNPSNKSYRQFINVNSNNIKLQSGNSYNGTAIGLTLDTDSISTSNYPVNKVSSNIRNLATVEYVLHSKDLLKLNPKALPILTATDRSIALDSSDNKLKFWDGTSWHPLY